MKKRLNLTNNKTKITRLMSQLKKLVGCLQKKTLGLLGGWELGNRKIELI